ncbi:gustatory receptor 5a for trehalose-like [Epargyreus clarus]|uniref:gustatory receptor 5a for trehalose-like n=1 Tax=Epargyreus clarus TaxID=520877 RepID=UPI003C303FD6
MHSCLQDTMRLSRWAGVFPVEGLNKRDIGKLRFNIKSFYTLYYLSTIIMQTSITGFMVHWFLIRELSLNTISNLAFYVTGLISALFLLKLANEWPSLVRRAAKIEQRVTVIHVTKIRAVKFSAITYVVLILAAIEHSLSLIYKFKTVVLCYEDAVFGNRILKNYCHFSYPFVFNYMANVQSTFLWNFTDIMTMCFSLYLTAYFRDLNTLVNSQQENKTHNWEQLRYYYSQLVALVQAVDSKMCYLILLSIFTNLFFICLQLYNTLNINLFYYAYSFTFLMLRAAVMFFLAANVNTVASEPKYALSCVSSRDYNIHVQRFHRQLRYTTTALSGLFFHVTREMILKVFATIITYELVLLQFHKDDS